MTGALDTEMFINFWYPAVWSEKLTDQPEKVRMLGQNFVLFRDSEGRATCLSDVDVHRGTPAPKCTRVDAYPTDERYGIVFAFLGDLPEAERPTIMEIPHYGADGWRATYEGRETEFDFRRQLENALDPAHNEFVHPTHGFSGERDDYFVPELDVQVTEWGSGFLTTYFAPPLKDKKMKAATARSDNAVITAGTFHHGPTMLCTTINPTPDSSIRQNVFYTPIDERRTRVFLVQMRNFLLNDETDARFHERNKVVAGQDAVVLADINPPVTPEVRTRELFMPADKAILRYRDYLDEWEDRGWRIDSDAVAGSAQKIAYAIPSPARREDPRAWVLDAVPLKPASDCCHGENTEPQQVFSAS